MSRFAIFGTVACVALSVVALARANPSQDSPNAPLDGHGLAKSAELIQQTQSLFEQCGKTIPNLAQQGARMPGQLIRQQSIVLRQLRRLALDLQMCGETAGYDYSLRTAVLETQLKAAIGQYKPTNAGLAQAAKDRQILAAPATNQVRNAALEKIKQLARQQKWAEAYNVLNDIQDKLSSYGILLEAEEQRPILAAFADVAAPLVAKRNTQFRQQVQDVLDQAVTAQLPNPSGLSAAVAAAAAGLRTAPSVDVEGKPLTGPQCLESFGNAWRQTQLAAIRCRALEWARRVGIPDCSYVPPVAGSNRIVDADYVSLADDVLKGLASLIEADAARATGADAKQLYLAHLQTAAPLVSATAGDKLQLALTAALEKLAAKSPEFAAEVTAYRAATDECLRWRARVAKSAAAGRSKNFLPSDQLLLQAIAGKGDVKGLLTPQEPKLGEAQLFASCPEVLPDAASRLVGQKVLVSAVVGLPGGKFCASRYQQRHYAMLPRPDVAQEIQRLKQDLLVSDQEPPLTLDAAVAITSAQQGDFVLVGGEVKDLYLEGLIPRFAKLPEAASPLVTLGTIPSEPPAERLLSHVLVRLNVTPSWVKHRYFFLELKRPPASGSTN